MQVDDIRTIAFKLDELREHITAVHDHVAFFLPGERDPIAFDHLTKASDLGRHLSGRLSALIDELSVETLTRRGTAMHEVTIEGVLSPITGQVELTDLELTEGMQTTNRSDFVRKNPDGTFTMQFPSAEAYDRFIARIKASSAPEPVKSDILRRHSH